MSAHYIAWMLDSGVPLFLESFHFKRYEILPANIPVLNSISKMKKFLLVLLHFSLSSAHLHPAHGSLLEKFAESVIRRWFFVSRKFDWFLQDPWHSPAPHWRDPGLASALQLGPSGCETSPMKVQQNFVVIFTISGEDAPLSCSEKPTLAGCLICKNP